MLVLKPDETPYFCIDIWRVNAISKFAAYPMHWIDELLECLGEAHFITTFDLMKGYLQIPLEQILPPMPIGFYKFSRMPLGLSEAPATFQRLIDHLLQPHGSYTAAYLNSMVIYNRC